MRRSQRDLKVDVRLHEHQLAIFNDPHRFIMCVAGRRFGKSILAVAKTLTEALLTEKNGYDLSDQGVFYVAPTFEQAKRIAWTRLKRLAAPVMKDKYENTGRIVLINDRWIEVKGADKPDSLRGSGISHVTLDEYADMKSITWEEILRPALADVKGSALFIGTPKGKNHMWSLWEDASRNPKEWGLYEFASKDNPFLDPDEIESARQSMTTAQFRQEFEAKFTSSGGTMFKPDWMKIAVEPTEGEYLIAIDLAGFVEEADKSKYKRLDKTAIACVKIHEGRWHVKEIRAGRWGIRETATQILKACRDYGVRSPGIEKGALMNAVMPYLSDVQRRLGFYISPIPLYHGGKHKIDRVWWALGGLFEHGRITLNQGAWTGDFIDEAMDFPNKLASDDMLDSLAYVAQLADTVGGATADIIEWEPAEDEIEYSGPDNRIF